ncbi:MAG: hypothetical protein H6Q71_2797 [Firmicutes bacterium]|nr:hypothetical protein [Bacillota bacterium]
MCQVNAAYTLSKMGDVNQIQQSLQSMETVKDITINDNTLSLSFNHHKYTEFEIIRVIQDHGFEINFAK